MNEFKKRKVYLSGQITKSTNDNILLRYEVCVNVTAAVRHLDTKAAG